jgi:hypothetical protein
MADEANGGKDHGPRDRDPSGGEKSTRWTFLGSRSTKRFAWYGGVYFMHQGRKILQVVTNPPGGPTSV